MNRLLFVSSVICFLFQKFSFTSASEDEDHLLKSSLAACTYSFMPVQVDGQETLQLLKSMAPMFYPV